MTNNIENIHDVAVLLDIDGTISNTAAHMTGLTERLSREYPEIRDVAPRVRVQRRAFLEQYKNLTHQGQDDAWQQQYPNTSLHSQLDVYRSFAPHVFTEDRTAEVYEWLSEPSNFAYAEYSDVDPMMNGLRDLGAMPVLFTLGQTMTSDGKAGWQELKIKASPRLSQMRRHIADKLPDGGKSQVIDDSYDREQGLFTFPTTDRLGPIVAKKAVLVDDSIHNLHMAEPAVGILIDRKGKHADWDHPSNIHVVASLEQVPAIVEEYINN